VCRNLAVQKGDYAAARASYAEAHRICLATLGHGHGKTQEAAKWLVWCAGK